MHERPKTRCRRLQGAACSYSLLGLQIDERASVGSDGPAGGGQNLTIPAQHSTRKIFYATHSTPSRINCSS